MVKRDSFLKHQLVSLGYSLEGIIYNFKTQIHFKIHILAALLVIILGIIYSLRPLEWAIIILVSSVVIGAEAINTAIEETCNLLYPDVHPKARLAKHCAAAGVLIIATGAVFIGAIIFIPKILGL